MNPISEATAIVAEDEETLRGELVEQLGRLWPELCIVGEAADGVQALRLIEQHRPDVVFLDIQMPGVTGLEVGRQVAGHSHIVFLTAYDQHAVAAFDQGAVDYVLKPLATARLFTAISRVKQRLASSGSATAGAGHHEYAAGVGLALDRLGVAPGGNAGPPLRAYLRWINASVGQTLKLITVDEVLYFQSDNKYTRVATRDSEALIRKPLKELVEELDPDLFWQVHRSTLVNANAVAGVSRDFHGRMQIKLKERSETLLVAESYAHRFRQM